MGGMLVPVAVGSEQCQGIRELTRAGAAPGRGKVMGWFPFLKTSVWAQPQGVCDVGKAPQEVGKLSSTARIM